MPPSSRPTTPASALPGGPRTQAAYEHVKEQLLDGRFRPGDRLPLQEVLDAVGVSRQPVMVAMQQLARDGLVEIIPQVGCVAATESREAIDDFYRYFAASEGVMAELAAKRGTEEEIADLRATSDRIGALLAPDVPLERRGREYRRLNRQLHGQIHAMARSPRLAGEIAGLWDRSDYYIGTGGADVPFARRLPVAQREHEEILAALERGDAAGARRAMEAHILTSLSVAEDEPSGS